MGHHAIRDRACPPARAIRDVIRAAGARLAFLPPYSPDLNPIEQVFAKVKHWLRVAPARTVETIHNRIANLVEGISQAECESYSQKRRICFRLSLKESSNLAGAPWRS
jgi:transposase